MPSAHGQYHNVMMEDKSLERAAITEAESNVFICTECGEGFNQYHKILAHMSLHGALETFPSSSGSSNGFEFPKEYVLQENGTLTMINGSQSANVPSHTPLLTSPLHPTICNDAVGTMPTAVSLNPSPCIDSTGAKPTVGRYDPSSPVQNTERCFECTLCCQIFQSREELRKHLSDHADDRFNCCGLCGKRFLTMDSLNIHQKEFHIHGHTKVEKTYACKKCGSEFFWFTDFQTHTLYHCKGFKVKRVVQKLILEPSHERGHLNGNSPNFKPLASSPEVTDNASDCKSYQCGLCGDRFNQLVALKEHHLIHQTQEEMDQLNQEAQITFHRRAATPNTMQERGTPVGCSNRGARATFPCKQCHRVFNHSSSLSRHMRYHKRMMHKCPFCTNLFPQRCDAEKHIDMHHHAELKESGLNLMTLWASPFDSQRGSAKQEKSVGKYECEDCGKKFGLLSVYRRHLRYHKKEPTENLTLGLNNCTSSRQHIKTDRGGRVAGVTQTTVQEKNPEKCKWDNKIRTMNTITDGLYECNECTETFSCLQMFLQHQNSHSFKNCG